MKEFFRKFIVFPKKMQTHILPNVSKEKLSWRRGFGKSVYVIRKFSKRESSYKNVRQFRKKTEFIEQKLHHAMWKNLLEMQIEPKFTEIMSFMGWDQNTWSFLVFLRILTILYEIFVNVL